MYGSGEGWLDDIYRHWSWCGTYANDDCGATNSSSLLFVRPSSRAVRLWLESCTSLLRSSRRTMCASALRRTWALMDGHTAATKARKFGLAMCGEWYS
jgi:hypothetical protein